MRPVLKRDQRGVALPSPVVLLSAAAVALAAIAFAITGHHNGDKVELADTPSTPVTSAPQKPSTTAKPHHKPAPTTPKIDRGKTKVLVYNDTNISGLASKVGARVTKAGWHFVAADNWAGTIPATTVYYPSGMKDAAHQLALDLGIKRIYPRDPAATGMLPDGLTVILLDALS